MNESLEFVMRKIDKAIEKDPTLIDGMIDTARAQPDCISAIYFREWLEVDIEKELAQ